MRRLVLALLFSLVVGSAEAGVLDATWTAPTTNTDGSALTDLASYRLYWFLFPNTPCPGTQFLVVPSPTTAPTPNTAVTKNLPGLTQGFTYNVQVTAVDTAGNESACSTMASAAARADTGTFTMAVGKAGTGQGTVTSSPAGIACGAACSSAFPAGSTVTLTATPAAGSTFAGWSGACAGPGPTCSPIMAMDQATTATFDLVPTTNDFTVTGLTAGQTVSGLLRVSAAPIAGTTPTGFTFALLNGVGATIASNPEGAVPYCFMGDPGALPCNPFDTTTALNGAYTMRVTMNVAGGTVVTKTIAFTIANGPTAKPTPGTNLQIKFGP